MAEDNQENNENKNQKHVPYLAPVDEQIRSGNMGLYLDDYQDKNETKKRFFLLLILALTIIGLLSKAAFFDQKAQEQRRQEMIEKVEAFERYIAENERISRELRRKEKTRKE